MVKDHIILSKVIHKECREVWKYFTKTHHLQNWWGSGVSMELILGGSFVEKWLDQSGNVCVTYGRIVDFKQNSYLKILWQDEGWEVATLLEVWFVAVKSETKVKIKHSGFSVFIEGGREELLKVHEKGWKYHLSRLQKYIDEKK